MLDLNGTSCRMIVHNFGAWKLHERKKMKKKHKKVIRSDIRIYADFEGSYCFVYDGHEFRN